MKNPYNKWIYPGGEVGVRIENAERVCTFRIQNSDDLVAMLMVIDAYKEDTGRPILSVLIPYLPYARQDRVATKGDPLAVRVLAKMLASAGIKYVYTVDVHSHKSIDLFEEQGISLVSNSPAIFIRDYLKKLQVLPSKVAFIAPDHGSREKTENYCKELKVDRAIQCAKKRDPITGKLTGFAVEIAPSATQAGLERDGITDLVITDDICDGGGTFHGVAEAIRSTYGSGFKLHLWTTHGIYSKGIDPLLQTFDTLGCTNTFINNHEPFSRFHVIEAIG